MSNGTRYIILWPKLRRHSHLSSLGLSTLSLSVSCSSVHFNSQLASIGIRCRKGISVKN